MSLTLPEYADPLVAVGAPLGALYDENNQPIGNPDAVIWVRLGEEFLGLGVDATKVWGSAFAPAEREDLAGLVDDASVQELIDGGLLASLKPPEVNPALLELVPVPLAMGDGSSDDQPDFYVLVDNDTHEIARMDFQHYILWSYFSGRATIGEATEKAERHLALPPGALLARLPQLLGVLLRTRAIFLDRR